MLSQILPTNDGLPLLGNLIQYILTPYTLLQKNQQGYQDIVKLNIQYGSLYLITNPVLIEEVLVHKYSFFRQDVLLHKTEAAIVGMSLGGAHKPHQHMEQSAFYEQHFASIAQQIVQYSQNALREIPNKTYFDIHQVIRGITLKYVCQALFSGSQSRDMVTVSQALHTITQRFDNQHWHNIVTQICGGDIHKKIHAAHKKAVTALDNTIDEIVRERLEYREQPNDMLGMLIKSRDENGQSLSLAEIRDECKTILITRHHTTVLSVSWAMWLIHSNPAIAQRLHAEVAQVLNGRPPRLADMFDLVYSIKVIRESMRIKPPIWLIERETLVDIEIGGYRIPASQNVAICPLAIHNDPRWYSDPKQYNPDRWTDEFTEKLPRHAFFPLQRQSPVWSTPLAILEATILLVMFMQRGNWQIDPKHTINMPLSTTICPNNGIRMLVKYS